MLSLDTFDELCTIPDLTRVEAAIGEKNLPVKAKKANLGIGTEINGETVCFKLTTRVNRAHQLQLILIDCHYMF